MLDDDIMASFSDGGERSEYYFFLANFIKKEYNINVPPIQSGRLGLSKFSLAARAMLSFDPQYYKETFSGSSERHFEKLGIYIKRSGKYGFFLKGGNNGEEHNHNDIGSFIIAKNNKQIFCDLGAAEYTASNFGKDRYKILNNSSRGHSVPLIDNSEQGTGAEFSGELKTGGSVSVDMSKAYPLDITKFERKFLLCDDSVTLSDEFDPSLRVTERFITEIKPDIAEDKITIDSVEVFFEEGWKPVCSVEMIPAHGGKTQRTVYIIDFTSADKSGRFRMEIKL